MRAIALTLLCFSFTRVSDAFPANWALPNQSPADKMLRAHFVQRVAQIESASRLEVSPDRWPVVRDRLRGEFKEMLGLDPEPPRGEMKVTITGTFEGDGFIVENLHFQPVPGLYLAANLFRPNRTREPLPTILYLSGHAKETQDGISFGNKTHYHHHGVWFARHDYVCLVLDTIQWGEILGEHHGTHRLGRWWWPARGYTPAGVEAWNAVRAIDYLVTRGEVDKMRIGVTGRSGGGAYSWWVAAIDDRVKVAAPTAGIATLRNHVLDGCIEGHCDCMFMQNTYGWDYDRVAALVAPRPLLILNTDKDDIFPLDGVYSIYQNTRRLHDSLGAGKNLGLHLAEGPHKDTQPLNTGAFSWFERFFNGADPMKTLDEAAAPTLERDRLRVFAEIPKDQRTTRIDETFVPRAPAPTVPENLEAWRTLRDGWMTALNDKIFRGWSSHDPPVSPVAVTSADRPARYEFLSEGETRLHLDVARPKAKCSRVILRLTDGSVPRSESADGECLIDFSPRGIGPNAWSADERKMIQIRRRFILLGQTLEGQQIWDIRRAIQALRAIPGLDGVPLELKAEGEFAGLVLYAALFEPRIARLDLRDLPESHDNGPCLLNVLKYFDMPQALAIAAERSSITLHAARPQAWTFATETAKNLAWRPVLEIKAPVALIDVKTK